MKPWAHSGYGTSGWAGIARPPCSWISAIVVAQRAERLDLAVSSHSPSRWPPRVVISSPTTTSTRQPAVARHRPAGERGVDPLVVGDADDVELGAPLDVVEDLDDAGRPIRGERVDVQVRATESLGHAAASRSGHNGWNTASHCSGAAATNRSNARASASR